MGNVLDKKILDDLINKIDNKLEKLSNLEENKILTLNDINEFKKDIREMKKIVIDNNINSYDDFLENNIRALTNFKEDFAMTTNNINDLNELMKDEKNPYIKCSIAENPNATQEMLRELSKDYGNTMAIIENPNTPIDLLEKYCLDKYDVEVYNRAFEKLQEKQIENNKENKMGNVFNLDNYIEGNSLYESYNELMKNGVYSELFNSDIKAKDFAMNFEYDGLDYDDFRESYKMFVDYNTNEFSMINIDEYNEKELKENINYFDFPSVNELNNLDNFFYDNLSNKLEDGYIDNKYIDNDNFNINDVNNENDFIKTKLAYNTTNDEIIRALENDGFKGHLVENDYYRDYIDNTIYKARQELKSFNDYVNNENLYSGNTNLELYNKVDFKFNQDGKIEDILKDGVSFKDIDSIALNVPNDESNELAKAKAEFKDFDSWIDTNTKLTNEDLRPLYNIEEQAKTRIEEIANKLNSNDFDDFVNDNFDGSFTNVLAKLDITKDDLGNILDVKNDGVSFKNNDNKSIENDREI